MKLFHTPSRSFRSSPFGPLGRVLLLLLVVALVWPPHAVNAEENRTDFAAFEAADSGTLLIGVTPGLSPEEVDAQLIATGLRLERYWPRMAVAAARPLEPNASAASLYAMAGTDYAAQTFRHVSPNHRVYAAETRDTLPEPPQQEPQPNDPLFGDQWAPPTIQTIESWNITHGSADVVVAVIDSGYDAGHPDFAGSPIWTNQLEADGVPGVDDDGNGYVDDIHGWDWVEYDNDPNDAYGHGTHVMGVIGAATDNAIGVAGIGRAVRVAPLRMLNSLGNGDVFDLIDAVDYAIGKEMDVINLSLTIRYDNYAIRDAMEAAVAAGISVVAAAGNDNTRVYWPAAYAETVAVAATDSRDRRSLYSNYGPEIDVAAPGSSILNLWTDSGYRTVSGTSMATPHVAGLFALLRSLRPDLDHSQLLNLVKSASDDANADSYPGEDDYLGAGRINLYQTLLQASSGLSIRTTPWALSPIILGEPLSLRARVVAEPQSAEQLANNNDTDEAIPVEGAVAYARVFAAHGGADAAEVVPIERDVTTASGNAGFAIDSPGGAGAYTVRVQVGAAYKDLSLEVLESPATIRLDVESTQLLVGDEHTEYSFRLLDEQNQLLTGEMPVRIATSLGTLDGANTSLNVIVQNGEFTGSLHGGTVSGSGQLSVTAGTATQSVPFEILPDGPARIRLFVADKRISATATDYEFETAVRDRYDNFVADNTPVRQTASAGLLSPTYILSTENGRVTFQLSVPAADTDAIVVGAEVAGYGLSDAIEVRTTRLWLPETQK